MKNISIILFVIISFVFINISKAEHMVFPNFSSTVTRFELDLVLFDYSVNNLKLFSAGNLNYIKSITSDPSAENVISCWVSADKSILVGTLEEKKERLKMLCNELFSQYQTRFMMIDTEYVKKPDEVGIPVSRMKATNLHIYIHTYGIPSLFLAEWEHGSMSYKDDFFIAK